MCLAFGGWVQINKVSKNISFEKALDQKLKARFVRQTLKIKHL